MSAEREDDLSYGYSKAYARRYERTGFDPLGMFGPKACWRTGHKPGCPGNAGGDHELREGWIAYEDEDGFSIEVEVVGR